MSISHITKNHRRTYRVESRREHENHAGGAQEKDVEGRVLDNGLCYKRYPNGIWAVQKQAGYDDDKYS